VLRPVAPAVLAVVLGFLLPACGPGGAGSDRETLFVFGAASLTDAITPLAADFEAATGRRVEVSFAASSTLARQIVAGAPADVFLSANPAWIQHVIDEGRARAEDRVDFAANRLVVVVRRGRPVPGALRDLVRLERIALADPTAAPAGLYAKRMFEEAGLWTGIAPRVVSALDVRAALRLVEIQAVDAAVVYATDARQSKGVVRADSLIPAAIQPEIRYAAVVCVSPRRSGRADAARAFIRFLRGPRGAGRLSAAGFTSLANEESP
jgi:molybdate transport system substrate-binding protein